MLVLDDTNFTTLITVFNDWFNAIAFVTMLFIFILNIVNCFLEYGSD